MKSIQERFWKKVSKAGPDDCWLWTAYKMRQGYGIVRHAGRSLKAHRVAWELAFGSPPPDELKVCHRCDVRACVNPNHLFLGSQLDNVRDMYVKGRAKRQDGERNNRAKLTYSDVVTVRELLAAGESQSTVARKFGVGQTQISRIYRGEHWGSTQ